MIVSTIMWLGLPALAFVPGSLERKAALGVGLFVVIEVLFYAGVLLAGRDVARRWARYLPSGWLDRLPGLLRPKSGG